MTQDKQQIINEILDLMLRSEISIRDLAAVLENTSLDACIPDMHEKIKKQKSKRVSIAKKIIAVFCWNFTGR
jgi:flagellar biosynthesis component FlhA